MKYNSPKEIGVGDVVSMKDDTGYITEHLVLTNYIKVLSMTSNKGLTLKDYNWINSKCRSIAKLEAHGIADKFIRNELYVLGVFCIPSVSQGGNASRYAPSFFD